MDWRHSHQAATHGVQPIFDPALYDDGGGPGPQLQGNGTGAPDGINQYYELCQNGNIHQASPGLSSTSLMDPNFVYYSSPHDAQVQTNTIQNNLLFDPYSGLHFLQTSNPFATQAPYTPLYHHPNPYAPHNKPLSMDLHHGADLAWLTASSSGPSARQGNHWESVPSSESFHGNPNHLEVNTLGGSQGAVTSIHPNPRYTLDSLASAPGYYGSGALSFPAYRNGQTHSSPNHPSSLFNLESNHSLSFGALSQSQELEALFQPQELGALSQCQAPVLDRREAEHAAVSNLNNYTSSHPIAVPQVHRSVERPFSDSSSTNLTSDPTPVDKSSYRSAPSGSEIRKSSSVPKVSTRKRKKSSRAVSSKSKSRKSDSQCHLRPLTRDQVDQVQTSLRPWFHNQVRCDPIPLELYRGMFGMVDGKEFCAIQGCTFETTSSRRRPGLKREHANRHLNHKPYYCLSCNRGYGRKEDHGLHPVILASSLPTNPYLSIPSPLTTHITDTETPHTLLA